MDDGDVVEMAPITPTQSVNPITTVAEWATRPLSAGLPFTPPTRHHPTVPPSTTRINPIAAVSEWRREVANEDLVPSQPRPANPLANQDDRLGNTSVVQLACSTCGRLQPLRALQGDTRGDLRCSQCI